MEKTWRWFGKKDKITLAMLQQIGVEGVVTALHEVPNGEIWTLEAIEDLRDYIESFGFFLKILFWNAIRLQPGLNGNPFLRANQVLFKLKSSAKKIGNGRRKSCPKYFYFVTNYFYLY